MSKIHSTAIIDPKAEIEESVEIGPYCVIDGGVRIAKGCRLDTHVRIKGRTTIGPNNQFFHSCTIGELPQDISFKDGSHSTLHIGEGNTIREHVQIHSSSLEKGTHIGDHNLCMSLSHIAHDAQIGKHNIIVQGSIIGGHCLIEDHVYIGGMSGLHPYVRVGAHAILGGYSEAVQDIPPYAMAKGYRCTIYGLNSIGLRRANFSPELRKEIKKAYKILFTEELSIHKGIDRVEKELMQEYKTDSEKFLKIKDLLDFIRDSKQGISSSSKFVSGKKDESF